MGFRDLIRPFMPPWAKKARHIVYVAKNATYVADGMMTVHDADFLQDSLFQEAYQLGRNTGSFGLSHLPWRVYVACWAGKHASQLDGDYVECGVNRGGVSRAVMHYINFRELKDRKFYLLDTFKGFPDDLKKVAAVSNLNDFQDCYEDVAREFSEFKNVVLIRGRVPDTLPEVPSPKIAYLHIDMNVAEPEVAAVDYFWDKMVPGGIVLFDDYGFGPAYRRQKVAIDAFATRRKANILLLPTGQGLIVKP